MAQVRTALSLAAAHAHREASMLAELRVLRARAVDDPQEASGGADLPPDGSEAVPKGITPPNASSAHR
jgi:hypothetical protein